MGNPDRGRERPWDAGRGVDGGDAQHRAHARRAAAAPEPAADVYQRSSHPALHQRARKVRHRLLRHLRSSGAIADLLLRGALPPARAGYFIGEDSRDRWSPCCRWGSSGTFDMKTQSSGLSPVMTCCSTPMGSPKHGMRMTSYSRSPASTKFSARLLTTVPARWSIESSPLLILTQAASRHR